jgi:hypothetical protein
MNMHITLITINWIFLKFNEFFNHIKTKLSEWIGFFLKLINYDNLKKNQKQKKKKKSL